MKVFDFIHNIFNIANEMVDFVFLGLGLFALFAYPIYFFVTNLNKYIKERKSAELISHSLVLLVVATFLGVIWVIPEFIAFLYRLPLKNPAPFAQSWIQSMPIFTTVRWVELALVFFGLAYAGGHEYGERRWLWSAVGHIAVIAFGWILNRWMGIIFVSLPLLSVYFFTLHDASLVILPASNPEDRAERKKRFHVLTSYTWGIQSPITVVNGHAWQEYKANIPGDITWQFSDFPLPIIKNLDWRPGMIWTRSHQAVSISGGMQFKRIECPGVAFTSRLERLDQVFDLRLQIRSKLIEVVSKDGIHFQAVFFAAFRLDNEEWNSETYGTLRALNPLLRGAERLTHTKGSFKYSNLRLQAALGKTSSKAGEKEELIYWDQWAMNIVEDQTRKVVSQKTIDQLWRPAEDTQFDNALDEIANEIKKNSDLILRAAGILLYVARVVNFQFPEQNGAENPKEESQNKNGEKKPEKMDRISKQQIAAWASQWEMKRSKILSEAQAESERTIQEAHIYAKSALLSSIAEGLQKTKGIPNLSRYVIAVRFLSSMRDYIQKRASDETMGEQEKKKLEEIHEHIKEQQGQILPKG